MNERQLDGKRVAILATNGVEQVELLEPRQALNQAGARTQVIAPEAGVIQGWNHDERGDRIPVDATLDQVSPHDFDALLLPGGVQNPDYLRMNPAAVSFVRVFSSTGKPIAAICHGPWMLVEAGAVRGKKLTSWPSLKTDIENAGGAWSDQPVVVDTALVTSRKPDDIPAFNREMLSLIAATGAASRPQPVRGSAG
ncbi:MAG TPA: type 1 glutamine amidotransferase domain-containing protein [Chloroflexota bacterium]|nr:type 1 glutamine amidotransferase domain-containing protein [Chloroflexota bacterium]